MRTVTRDRSQVRVGPCHRPQREARPAHGAMDLRTDDRGALPARRSRGHPPRTDRSRAVDRQGPHAATPVFRSNQSGTSTSDSWELSAWKEARRRNGKRRRLQPVCPTGPGRSTRSTLERAATPRGRSVRPTLPRAGRVRRGPARRPRCQPPCQVRAPRRQRSAVRRPPGAHRQSHPLGWSS
jgi:hypothetical protein